MKKFALANLHVHPCPTMGCILEVDFLHHGPNVPHVPSIFLVNAGAGESREFRRAGHSSSNTSSDRVGLQAEARWRGSGTWRRRIEVKAKKDE